MSKLPHSASDSHGRTAPMSLDTLSPRIAAVSSRITTNHCVAAGGFLAGISIVALANWGLGAGILATDQSWDRTILQAINLTTPSIWFDAIALAVTDGSLLIYGLAMIWLACCSTVATRFPHTRPWAALTGVGCGLVLAHIALGMEAYATILPGVLMAVGAVTAFAMAALYLLLADLNSLKHIPRLFLITVLAGIVTMLICDVGIGELVQRPRPLNPDNNSWNESLRVVLGERVITGSSFVSGHASQMFALLTPLALHLIRRGYRLLPSLMFIYGAIHGWTRIYLAAHFPTDVLAGSIDGIAIGALAWWLLWPGTRPSASRV